MLLASANRHGEACIRECRCSTAQSRFAVADLVKYSMNMSLGDEHRIEPTDVSSDVLRHISLGYPTLICWACLMPEEFLLKGPALVGAWSLGASETIN
jgi:hypothetical protein